MQSTTPPWVAPIRTRRLAPFVVFIVGLALTAGFIAIVTEPSLHDSLIYRYCCGHPIEKCEVWLFFWGMAALGWKAWQLRAERRVLRQAILPLQAGRVVAIADVPNLLQALAKLPGGLRTTWFVRRLADALAYVYQRGAPDDLEVRLGVLGDRDADELEGSYELVRNITWAIPILGFLGTVVGITIAIANITPEQLQDSLDQVVGGLAVAFDTTALALALSMVLVLAKFLVERAEKGVLSGVETAVEERLLHRFEKHDPETRVFLGMIEAVANVVMQSTQAAWREQGQLWTKAIEQVGESQVAAMENAAQQIVEQSGLAARQLAADQSYQFADTLKRLEKLQEASTATISGLREVSREWLTHAREDAHEVAVRQETQFSQFLAGLEGLRLACHKSLADVATKMTAHQAAVRRQTELLAQLVADEGRVSKFQQSLADNLATLANVQALDETIHSLSAAAHLLTARLGRLGSGPRLSVSDDSTSGVAA